MRERAGGPLRRTYRERLTIHVDATDRTPAYPTGRSGAGEGIPPCGWGRLDKAGGMLDPDNWLRSC